MKIFAGNSNPELAQRISEYLENALGEIEITRFPDGEIFVKIMESIRGEDVFVVQSTCKPPNENLMELLIMIDAMKRASAARITAVLPFYGYARQDRKDQPRVPISAKLVADLLTAAGANRVLTMDLHAQQIQGFFNIPVDHLYAAPVIGRHLMSMNLDNATVVAPDTGNVAAAHAYARMLASDLAVVAKKRHGPADVEALTLVGDVAGRTAVIVDDMATTSGTICSAADFLKEHGAKRVYAAVSHACVTEQGWKRLAASPIAELITTDSIPFDAPPGFAVKRLTVAEILGEAIVRIHENRSVTSLFKY